MRLVERRVTRTTQPQDVTSVDWNNPLTKGLLGSWVGSGRGKAAFGTDAVPQGNAVAKVGQIGVGLSNNSTGSNNFWKVERGNRYTYTQQVTFEALVEIEAFNNVPFFISGIVAQYVQPGSSADDRGPFLRLGNGVDGNQTRPFFAVMQSNTEKGVLGPPLQIGLKYHLLGTYDGSAVKLFINGELIGTTFTTGSFENGNNTYVAIGTDYPGTSNNEFRAFQGKIYLANVYNTGKTNDQAKALADNPYQIFEPEIQYEWIDDSIQLPQGKFYERYIPRTSQPQDGVGIDWSNPITRGLVGVKVGDNPTNLANGTPPLRLQGTRSRKITRAGVEQYGTSAEVAYAGSVRTYFWHGVVNTANQRYGGAFGAGSANGIYIEYNSGFRFVVQPGFNITSTGVALSALPQSIAFTTTGDTSHKGYVDGRFTGAINGTTTISQFIEYGLMYRQGNSLFPDLIDGNALVLAFNRALSDVEVKSISDNPWQIFEPELQRVWVSDAIPSSKIPSGRYYERYLPRTTQPQDAVGIDTSSRFARSLKSLIVGGVNNDIITGLPLTVANPAGVALTPTAYGNSWHNTTGAVSTLVPTIGNAPCLFIYRGYVPNPNSQEAGTNYLFGSSDNGVGLHIGVGGFLTNWYMFGIAAVNANEVFPGGWVTIVVHRKSDGTTRLFRDGVFKNAGTSEVKTLNEARFAVGSLSHNSPTASGFNVESQTVLFGVSANEDFSDAEIAEISQNTNCIFEPEVERIWVADYDAPGGLTQVQSDADLNYVLRAIIDNSRFGMYSILGLVNSDINASYNVTESRVNSSSLSYVINAAVTQDQPESYNVRAGVDSTQNETYNILGAVQQSQNEQYNVLASLSSTQGSTYNVRSSLSKDQGSTYFISESTYREQLVDYVIRSQQHNDQSVTYSILSANSVGNNADLNYVISALIQQDQQENYLVRSSAHQETNGVYTVRSSAESTTEGSYAVRASLTGDATLDYSIRAEVNSSGSMSYTVRASLSKDQGLLYDILAASNVQASSSASYVIQATTANNTTCSYQIQGEVIDLPLTNAEMQQLYAWVGELVNKSATKEEIATAVWSKPQSELTVENSIGKWLMQKVLTVSKFLALK